MQRTSTVGINRRHVLIGGGLLAAIAAVPACGTDIQPTIDRLQEQRDLAVHDSELATSAVARAPKALRRALTQVATERSAHAEALDAEITRVAGPSRAGAASTAGSASSSTASSAEPADAAGGDERPVSVPSVGDVRAALKSAAGSAGDLAAELSGYRAGLLASIAAACTAAHKVALVVQS